MGKDHSSVKIGKKELNMGSGDCFIVAEIGINHNGSLDMAKKLIDIAKTAGCDAVKFQKRTIDIVYTKEELESVRPTIFGNTNGDLKRALELGLQEYQQIDEYCKQKDILWFASCWDKKSVDFIEQFNPPCYKIASASLTDIELLEYIKMKSRPILLSTGMSTLEEIDSAVEILGKENLVLMHCTSTYPTELEEINLKVINTLKERYGVPVGYSGHERGLMPSVLAVGGFQACCVERHITCDRTLFGTDQAASLEPTGLFKLVRDIRQVQKVCGDGKKVIYEREVPIIKKLRKNYECV